MWRKRKKDPADDDLTGDHKREHESEQPSDESSNDESDGSEDHEDESMFSSLQHPLAQISLLRGPEDAKNFEVGPQLRFSGERKDRFSFIKMRSFRVTGVS